MVSKIIHPKSKVILPVFMSDENVFNGTVRKMNNYHIKAKLIALRNSSRIASFFQGTMNESFIVTKLSLNILLLDSFGAPRQAGFYIINRQNQRYEHVENFRDYENIPWHEKIYIGDSALKDIKNWMPVVIFHYGYTGVYIDTDSCLFASSFAFLGRPGLTVGANVALIREAEFKEAKRE